MISEKRSDLGVRAGAGLSGPTLRPEEGKGAGVAEGEIMPLRPPDTSSLGLLICVA